MIKLHSYIPIFIGILFSSLAFVCGSFFFISHNYAINFSRLSHYNPNQACQLLDDEGNGWARFQLDKRDPIDGSSLPAHVINAFIAAEDWNFFSHHGLSLKGIVRSLVINLYYGRKAQGASTITQQLVKLLFFDSQKTFSRKIKEQLYAILVEQQFTKDQILQTYVNHVCFGCGIYGIEAASQRFWAKHAHELTIDEAATLAGIICAPARYCPLVYPLSAQRRRDIVLGKMHYLKYISDEIYSMAITKTIEIKEKTTDSCAPYVKEMARLFLEEMFGKTALYSKGLQVKTTINARIQKAAQEAFVQEVTRLKSELHPDIEGGMIVLDRKTGEIKALVGGYDFCASPFNWATQAYRQIGSTIKPLIYAVALAEGRNCADTEIDEPIEIVQNGVVWAPKNYNKKFNGLITLAYAISHSNNIATIKTFLRLNPKKVVELAQKCRMTCPFHTYPSLALGCVDTTLLEVAGMFNVFANDGIYVEPHYISWVNDQWGNRLYKAKPEQERVVSSSIVGQIGSVLCLGPERVKMIYGKDNWISSQAMSKTGTTNGSTTCWFVGSTPSFTMAVVIGCKDNRPMGDNVYPIKTAFPIWLAVNKMIESPEKTFSFDPSLKRVVIDERTGMPSVLGRAGAISILM